MTFYLIIRSMAHTPQYCDYYWSAKAAAGKHTNSHRGREISNASLGHQFGTHRYLDSTNSAAVLKPHFFKLNKYLEGHHFAMLIRYMYVHHWMHYRWLSWSLLVEISYPTLRLGFLIHICHFTFTQGVYLLRLSKDAWCFARFLWNNCGYHSQIECNKFVW